MFELKQAIADWRQQMLAAGIQTPMPLEELESHLREEIERQVKTGLNVQQAFAVAMRQMGKADRLNKEFKKEAKEARDWKLFQIIWVGCLCLVTAGFANVLFHHGLTSAQRGSGLTALAVFNLLPVTGRLAYRFFPVIPNQRIRGLIHVAIGVLGVLGLTIFFKAILPQITNTANPPTVVTGLWGVMVPLGILCALIVGIETAAWKNPRPLAE